MTPGQKLYAAVAPKALEMEHAVFGRFSQAELDGFTEMLRRIDAAVLDAAHDYRG